MDFFLYCYVDVLFFENVYGVEFFNLFVYVLFGCFFVQFGQVIFNFVFYVVEYFVVCMVCVGKWFFDYIVYQVVFFYVCRSQFQGFCCCFFEVLGMLKDRGIGFWRNYGILGVFQYYYFVVYVDF